MDETGLEVLIDEFVECSKFCWREGIDWTKRWRCSFLKVDLEVIRLLRLTVRSNVKPKCGNNSSESLHVSYVYSFQPKSPYRLCMGTVQSIFLSMATKVQSICLSMATKGLRSISYSLSDLSVCLSMVTKGLRIPSVCLVRRSDW